MTDQVEIRPLLGKLAASVTVPGSKSITNRALLMAAMAAGRSTLSSALISDDTRYMIAALQDLGFAVRVNESLGEVEVNGGAGKIPRPQADLFVGGSGTAMRFLAGFLTLGQGAYRLDGNSRMRQRPIGDLLQALSNLGLVARSERDNGYPPVLIEVNGGGFKGGITRIDASLSSQFVSALLLPAPLWPEGLRLTIDGLAAKPFVLMTLRLMQRAGIRCSMDGNVALIPGGQNYRRGHTIVEADASSASYFAAAAVICEGRVRLNHLRRDSVQGDVHFLELLEQMGARVTWQEDAVEVAGADSLQGVDVDMSGMPDMVPSLAVLAPFANSPTTIRKVQFIRHHESDRLHALAVELGRLGVAVDERPDGLVIHPATPKAASIETYDDHRIAMSFSVLGLRIPGIRIKDPGCVSKTYPQFFVDLASLG